MPLFDPKDWRIMMGDADLPLAGQKGADEACEAIGVEWLGHVLFGAGVANGLLGIGSWVGRHRDYFDGLRLRVRLDAAADLKSVHAGHVRIENPAWTP